MNKTEWTLFLDRDGVINVRLPDQYVHDWSDFTFSHRCMEAMPVFKKYFDTTVVVTNQQGIGKGIMTKEQLDSIHVNMLLEIEKNGGLINKVYYSPHLRKDNPPCRKPNTGMAYQAKRDFPTIDFQKCVMVGDSFSDMEFGWQMGMKTIFIEGKEEENERTANIPVDERFENLWQFAEFLERPESEFFIF